MRTLRCMTAFLVITNPERANHIRAQFIVPAVHCTDTPAAEAATVQMFALPSDFSRERHPAA
jgi:hypothetical protein